MKLTKLGKIVFTIYNCIMCVLAYYVASKIGGYAVKSVVYGCLCIVCWARIFLTPFYLSLIWEV